MPAREQHELCEFFREMWLRWFATAFREQVNKDSESRLWRRRNQAYYGIPEVTNGS